MPFIEWFFEAHRNTDHNMAADIADRDSQRIREAGEKECMHLYLDYEIIDGDGYVRDFGRIVCE
jgi:hypothetical protein